MDWGAIGIRIRNQREQFGYTREQFAEMLNVTPKFCADIELGNKGMSVNCILRRRTAAGAVTNGRRAV